MCICTEPHLVDLLAVVSLFVARLLRLSKGICGLLHRSQRQRVRLHRRHRLVEGVVHLRVGDAADVARRSNAARQYGGLVQLRGLQKYERGVETGRTQTPSMRRSGSRQHRVSSHRAVKCECVVFGREHDHSRPEQLDPVSIRTYVRLRAVWILAAFSGERGSEAASL